jgi:hypothetical protein
MASDFAGQIDDWVRNSQALVEGVFRESTQRVFDVMTTPRGQGGNLPVDTGYLWHSAQASTDAPIPIDPSSKGEPGQSYALDSGPVSLVINGSKLGDTTYLTFTASYAAHVDLGTSRQPAALFVEQAAQQWPQIVEQVQSDLKGQMAGG